MREKSIVEINVPDDFDYGSENPEGLERVSLEDLDGAKGYVLCDCGASAIVHVRGINKPVFLSSDWLSEVAA